MLRIIFLLSIIISAFTSRSQDFSYKHYTVKDGLVSSTIYSAVHDKNGFIWFATNQGVSRYDGHTFKNFTKEDGLPDNEIIKLYVDKNNNIWFISLIGIPSVFINGKITAFNHLSKVVAVAEDFGKDSIYLVSGYDTTFGYYRSVNKPMQWNFSGHIQHLHKHNISKLKQPILRASGKQGFKYYFSIKDDSLKMYTLIESLVQFKERSRKFSFAVSGYIRVFPFRKHSFTSLSPDERSMLFFTKDSLYISSLASASSLLSLQDLGLNVGVENDLISLFYENSNTVWLCTRNKGLLKLKNFNAKNLEVESYFKDAYCTSISKDFQGGYWLTTHNNGVYYMPGQAFRQLNQADANERDAVCVRVIDTTHVAAGYGDGNITLINSKTLAVLNFPEWQMFNKNNRVVDIAPYINKTILAGTDKGVYKISPRDTHERILDKAIKSVFVNNQMEIIAASASGVNVISSVNFEIFGTRATSVTGLDETFFWGTFHGAYSYTNGRMKHLAPLHPVLSRIINHIDIDSSRAIWFSTPDGLVIKKGNKIYYISKTEGMPSNFCKHTSFNAYAAWVSTDQGIAKIEYRWKNDSLSYQIFNITEDDGLISNNVNQTAVLGEYVWAATSTGVCFFSTDFRSNIGSRPFINVTKIINGKTEITLSNTPTINATDNKLLIELSPVSYHSGKQIAMQYRLKGIDSSWNNIAGKTLELNNLPYGEYALELRAIDRWGYTNKLAKKVLISHPPPFWKTWWFITTSYVFTALLMGFIVYSFNKKNERKKDKKQQLIRKINDLEMMALRAQMNPHFIFNCLNSIQHHILRADTSSANLFLQKFSQLIRKTLQYSAAPTILLSEEISMLVLYLDLEKLRLGKKLTYSVEYPNELTTEDYKIPSMIIQPFVENAIKHGISPLIQEEGVISISFKKSGSRIECLIEDNGRGIKHSADQISQHTPMGITITENRIAIMNTIQKDHILLRVEDRQDLAARERGTRVKISFSIFDQV